MVAEVERILRQGMVVRTMGTGPMVGFTQLQGDLGLNLGSTASWLNGGNKNTYLVQWL